VVTTVPRLGRRRQRAGEADASAVTTANERDDVGRCMGPPWPGQATTLLGGARRCQRNSRPPQGRSTDRLHDTEAPRGATARRVREVSGVAALLRLSRTGYVARALQATVPLGAANSADRN